MRHFHFLSICLLFALGVNAQTNKPYFQQHVDYEISAVLNDTDHRLQGAWKMTYTNNSPDELSFIYMHLWPNAYLNTKTAYANQQVRNGSLKFEKGNQAYRGGLYNIEFKANGQALKMEPDPENPDIVKVTLASPLAPGKSITLSTDYLLDIPKSTSRMGHVGQSYQMTQWYPKPAVYDNKGWHAMPYLNQGEFFSEFGDFDVNITLPANYIVGATGELLTEEEIVFLNVKVAESDVLLESPSINPKDTFPPSSDKTKTIRYKAQNVHDFAWFADKRFYVLKEEAVLPSGKKIPVWAMFTNVEREIWKEGAKYVKRAIEFYSENVGEYPYPQATAVMSALSAGAGMEYPMITVIGKSGDARTLDIVITHEVGHNWFYGILASNERDHPWMDEGMNSFYEQRYTRQYYGASEGSLPKILTMGRNLDDNQMLWEMKAPIHKDQAPDTHSEDLEALNYGLSPYMKPALDLFWLENYLGKAQFDKAMKQYYEQWKFKHPYPEDFQLAMRNANPGKAVDWVVNDLLMTDKRPDYAITKVVNDGNNYQVTVKNRGEVAAPFSLGVMADTTLAAQKWFDGFSGKQTVTLPNTAGNTLVLDPSTHTFDQNRDNNYYKLKGVMKRWEPLHIRLVSGMNRPDRNTLYVLPMVMGNANDGTMPMLILHNGQIPNKKFSWGLLPAWSFRRDALRGMATGAYQFFPDTKVLYGVRIGGEVSRFGNNDLLYTDPQGNPLDVISYYTRYSGYLSLLPQHSDRSHRKSDLTARFTQIQSDWSNTGMFEFEPYSNNLLSLTYQYKDPNVLWARSGMVSLQSFGAKGIDRTNRILASFTQNYAIKKNSFIRARVFAGAVLSETNSYYYAGIPLVGNSAFDIGNDHLFTNRNSHITSSDYSRQIAPLGAGLKVPVNITNVNSFVASNYAAGLNLSAPIPVKFLSIVRPYFDVVYFNKMNELTAKTETGVYSSGGLMLSAFQERFSVHFPLYYNKPLRDLMPAAYRQRITFSMNLPIFNLFNGSIHSDDILSALSNG